MSMTQNFLYKTRKARTLCNTGKLSEAATLLDEVLTDSPNNLEAMDILAEIAFRLGDYSRVIDIIQSMISENPDNASYHTKIATVHAIRSEFRNAAAHYRKAIQLDPDHFPAHLDLCKVARELGQLDESIHAGRNAIRLKPGSAKAHSYLGMSYEQFGLHQKAREHYEHAAKLSPNNPHMQFAGGLGCLGTGEKEAAKRYFERVISLQPDHAQAYWMLARLTRLTSPDHKYFPRLHNLLKAPNTSDEDHTYFHFSLGKMYEDCGLYDKSFSHYDAGNRLENRKYHYSPDAYKKYVGRLIECFSVDLLQQKSLLGHTSALPVFVIGMPRTGTTLLEQILSSHPNVYGVGELPWFNKIGPQLPIVTRSSKPYPECSRALDERGIHVLAQKYLDYLGILSDHGNYTCIIDKTLDNDIYIGLISILFPNARIIHCRRDPLDTAISMYSLIFPGAVDYSYDLFNIGTHYTQHERLMNHWKTVMPERIFSINYEDMVQDQETWTRKLLEFLDLPWNSVCLRFYESERTVRTYSESQVRKPMYSSSIGRWKHFETHLEPLHKGLNWFKETHSQSNQLE